MGWASGFKAGTALGKQLIDTYQQANQRREFEKIAGATPEESTGFTADQGDQLRAAADSGQYDIGYDEAAKAYTVTPKKGGETGMIGQQRVTDLLGNRTAGTMTPDQVNTAKLGAVADVLAKTDPVSAMRMRGEITRNQREDQRFGWEQSRNEREERTAAQKENDERITREVDAKTADWMKGRLRNEDGTERAAGVDDYLAATQFRAGQLASAGRIDAAGQVMKDYSAQSLVKIQLESAQRNEALGKTAAALAAGDLGAVRDFYNKFVPDGAKVTDVQRGENGAIIVQRETLDGRPLPATTMKDTGQLLSAMSSFKDPLALYNYSQNEFRNNLSLKQDARADRQMTLSERADARAGASAADARSERERVRKAAEEKADAAVALRKEIDPGATEAVLNAVRRGVMEALPESGVRSDFKPDSLGAGGTVTQTDKRGNVVVTKIGADGKPGEAVRIAAPGAPAAKAAKPATEAAAHAEAQAALKSGASREAVNQRLQSFGYAPLPGGESKPAKQAATTPAASDPAAAAPAMPSARSVLQPETEALGQAVEAARQQASAARDALLRYGTRQQKADPEGYAQAKAAAETASARYRAAEQAYTQKAAGELGAPGYGVLAR